MSTKTAAAYTLFMSRAGKVIEAPLTAICQSSHGAARAMLDRLRLVHGLDIRCVGYRRWLLAGRYAPDGTYTSYLEPCPYCSDGKRTGLPGNACENCMNTGLAHPEYYR